jgi:hypothetical protein
MKRQLTMTVLAALAAIALPTAAQRLAVNPTLPVYGQAVGIELKDAGAPVYMPATRYSRSGSTIIVDYEYAAGFFGPFPPSFGGSAVSLGELAAGNYAVQARLYDIGRPEAPPMVVSTNIAVLPPQDWGIYAVPREPQAFASAQAMIRSAAYFDPNSMRATVTGNVVRVDFTFKDDAPAVGATPPGMTTFASVAIPALAPGSYSLEGWGRPISGGPYVQYFTKGFMVASTVPVVEYYSAALDHYFISAGADEIAQLDRGASGDWKRTGQTLLAWMRASDAPPTAVAVCRFYARGPNSHFYTGSKRECDDLKALEQDQRAEATARGQPFLGWAYETIAFWAVPPQNGQCPGGLLPVYRAYNNRAAQMDSNHRLTTDAGQRAAMAADWLDEGVQLCSAS